jgi:hypothetical protein
VRSLGSDYITASTALQSGWPSYLAVTAWQPLTNVTVTPRKRTRGTVSLPPIGEGESKTFTLARGDVLLLYSDDDLTGSLVTSDKVVQVISGNTCADAGLEDAPCSHTEEALLPRSALFYEALVARIPDAVFNLRIIAAEAATTVTVTDGVTPVPVPLIGRGSYVDFIVGDTFLPSVLVTNSEHNPILVTQTIIGAPATTIYRPLADKTTLVQAPAFTTRAMSILAKQGDTVTIDGRTLPDTLTPTAIGTTGYVQWIAGVTDGAHVVQTPNASVVTVVGAQDLAAGVATFWY